MTLLTRTSMFRRLAVPLAAVMMFGSIPQASAARGVVWRDGPGKTVIVKPAHVVQVRHVRDRSGYRDWQPRYRQRHSYSPYYGYRSYGRRYRGNGYYTNDGDAIAFLGLTALTLAILNSASEAQQRAHEQALVEATQIPRGETIVWNDGPESGSVTVLRTGTYANGQPCRELSQAVTIGGQSETAYGTACRQEDGTWHIVN